jgi:hypothetical protein
MKQPLLLCLILLSGLASGFFQEAMAASGITANVAGLDFGAQADGTLSPPQSITLTNELNGDGIIGSILLTGENPLQFVIFEDFCSGVVLADLESCSLSVGFAPSVEIPHNEGLAQADLTVNFQDPPSLSIPLTGNILIPNIESNVSSLDFGSEVAGRLSDSQTVILTNTGDADLLIGATGSSRGDTVDFGPTLDLCSFQTLAPGESCRIDLAMRPTEVADRSAQFTIESNDPDQPLLNIDLFGAGTGSGGVCSLNKRIDIFSGRGFWLLFLILPLLRWIPRRQA